MFWVGLFLFVSVFCGWGEWVLVREEGVGLDGIFGVEWEVCFGEWDWLEFRVLYRGEVVMCCFSYRVVCEIYEWFSIWIVIF